MELGQPARDHVDVTSRVHLRAAVEFHETTNKKRVKVGPEQFMIRTEVGVGHRMRLTLSASGFGG